MDQTQLIMKEINRVICEKYYTNTCTHVEINIARFDFNFFCVLQTAVASLYYTLDVTT